MGSFFMRYTNDRPDGAIQAAISQAKAAAPGEWKNLIFNGEWATGGFGITSMRPYHIQAGGAQWGSSNYWASCYAASVTWENWINITQTELAFELIAGMFNLATTPKTVEVGLTAAGKTLPTLNVEEMYAYDVSRLYFQAPVLIYPNKPWIVAHKGINTGIEREGLVGYTIGTHSFLILRA